MSDAPDGWAPAPGVTVTHAGGRPRSSPKHDLVTSALEKPGEPLSRRFASVDEARRYVRNLRRVARLYGAGVHASYRASTGEAQAVIDIYKKESDEQ